MCANYTAFGGWRAWLAETVAQLARGGIPTCVHLGLTPQSVNVFGGYRVQGRGDAGERQLLGQAVLERAELALAAPARLGGIGGDVLDAEPRLRIAAAFERGNPALQPKADFMLGQEAQP